MDALISAVKPVVPTGEYVVEMSILAENMRWLKTCDRRCPVMSGEYAGKSADYGRG